jgi:hypothetical protein
MFAGTPIQSSQRPGCDRQSRAARAGQGRMNHKNGFSNYLRIIHWRANATRAALSSSVRLMLEESHGARREERDMGDARRGDAAKMLSRRHVFLRIPRRPLFASFFCSWLILDVPRLRLCVGGEFSPKTGAARQRCCARWCAMWRGTRVRHGMPEPRRTIRSATPSDPERSQV